MLESGIDSIACRGRVLSPEFESAVEPPMSTKPEPTFQSADLQAWAKAAAKSAPGGNVQALDWITPDGIAVKPLYTAADLQGLKYTDTLPGFEPYLRGPQATMYAVRPWTIRQYAGFSTAEESNAFYRKALPAQIGRAHV